MRYTQGAASCAPTKSAESIVRLRFWDKGTANGDWSDTIIVTVGP